MNNGKIGCLTLKDEYMLPNNHTLECFIPNHYIERRLNVNYQLLNSCKLHNIE